MGISVADYEKMQARLEKNAPVAPSPHKPVDKESKLAEAILEFCSSQWPRWLVVYARTDKKSTLPIGCHDQTIFASDGRVFCFELKAENKKPDIDQLSWHAQMKALGHQCHVIRSVEEFHEIIKGEQNDQTNQ